MRLSGEGMTSGKVGEFRERMAMAPDGSLTRTDRMKN